MAAHVISSQIQAWIDTDFDTLAPTQLSILDAAATAFTLHGFAPASIDLIAKQIGVTKGSVYYYYRSKADLFFAVHKRAMALNLREIAAIFCDSSLACQDKLHAMAYRHAMLMMEHLYYQRVTVQGVELHQSASTTPAEREALAEVVAMRDAYEDFFVQVLQNGVAQQLFADMDCALAAKSILGSLNWITVWFRPRETDTAAFRHKVAAQLARQAVQGLTPQA